MAVEIKIKIYSHVDSALLTFLFEPKIQVT